MCHERVANGGVQVCCYKFHSQTKITTCVVFNMSVLMSALNMSKSDLKNMEQCDTVEKSAEQCETSVKKRCLLLHTGNRAYVPNICVPKWFR